MDLKTLVDRSYPQERLFAGYLVFLALLIALAGAPVPDRWPRMIVHIVVAVAFVTLFPMLGETGWKTTLRHWLPVVLLAMVYTELDILNDMFTTAFHDEPIIAIDQALFRTQLAIELRNWLPYKPLSEYLHFAYFSYYFLFPILGIALFVKRKLNEFRYAATVTLAVFALCYSIFIFYPVSGPWNYYEQAPLSQVGHFAPALVHMVLLKGESIGTAFPSSHVAVAVAVWLVAWRVDRRVFTILAFLVPALVIGTIYGGFHYAIDAIVGVAVGVLVVLAAPAIYTALGGTPPDPVTGPR
jgi:membrane-associated phospholipid phosphatase